MNCRSLKTSLMALFIIPQQNYASNCTVSWAEITRVKNDLCLNRDYAPVEIANNVWAHFTGVIVMDVDEAGNLTEGIEVVVERGDYTPARGYLVARKIVPGAPKKKRLSLPKFLKRPPPKFNLENDRPTKQFRIK